MVGVSGESFQKTLNRKFESSDFDRYACVVLKTCLNQNILEVSRCPWNFSDSPQKSSYPRGKSLLRLVYVIYVIHMIFSVIFLVILVIFDNYYVFLK